MNNEFTIHFSGYSELTTELEDAVFEAGCDDGALGCRNFQCSVHFMREAESFADAVFSAMQDLKKVPGLQITAVETDDPANAHDAALINRTLELQAASTP